VDIFAEGPTGSFQLTPLATFLRSDTPGSMRAWARYIGAEWQWSLWGQVFECVRTGQSAYENVHGMRFFDWFARHPAEHYIFDQAMTSTSEMANPAIVAAYDVSHETVRQWCAKLRCCCN
jgi:hypothetical protein